MKDSELAQDLVFLDNRAAFTDSLIVARVFNKTHNNVLKDIRKVIGEIDSFGGLVKFEQSSYINSQNKKYPKFIMDKDALLMLVMSYEGRTATEIRYRYIQEFNKMQNYIELRNRKDEVMERERISAENGSEHGRGLYGRKVEKKANWQEINELDKQLSIFEVFELESPKATIH